LVSANDSVVSNPWREAIEADTAAVVGNILGVSNPWREAIEDVRCMF